MSTRSSARNLFPPFDNLELIIRRRSRADPTLLNDFEMAAEGNGDPPVPDLRTMEELCQPSLNGRGGPNAPIAIQATNFGLKNDTIQQVQNSCQFHGLSGGTFMKRRPEECYDLIENMTAHHNDWDTLAQRSESSSSITSSSDQEIVALIVEMEEINKNLMRVLQMNTASSLGSVTLPSNTITNPKEDLKGITTRSGTAYQGPTIPTTSSSLPQVVEHEIEVTNDTVPPTNNGSTKDVQPPVVQVENLKPNSEPVVAPIIEPVAAPVSALKPNQKPLIPFADALILMPKFGPTIKTLLTNKDKLSELARTPLNEYCSAVLLKKLPEKLGDPGKRIDSSCGKEAITFNLDQSSRYSANYNDMMANRIDVIDMAYEEYSQEVLSFSNVIPIDAFLALEDDATSPEVDHSYFDTEGDILLLEAFLNDDQSLTPPTQRNYLPQVQKELKICEAKTDKSSIDKPPEVELKDLRPHLEYTFLEGDDKLPVIIAKDLSVEEKDALIKVLKSHKQAIAWKLSDIKGINPEFCTHKILMEDDFEPAVQHQRRVNPKIHDVIKKEVLKLLDAGLIYPISDSPWVSPVHCIPKKGGFTVVENEENELIPTRLVTGWCVCIDYQKLNEATRKDHFPLPFIDRMLERLAGNEYYCFLDERLPIVACLLGYAMHRARSKGEKGHFMVKEGIVLGHKISKNGIEVDKAKVDVIAKLPHPTTVKGIRSFLGHAGFYRRFIQDFSKIARPMTCLLEKDTPFLFSKECVDAF
nr:reverse transcriptase domain-containing protein [Tanacetum cinerariifolium]